MKKQKNISNYHKCVLLFITSADKCVILYQKLSSIHHPFKGPMHCVNKGFFMKSDERKHL